MTGWIVLAAGAGLFLGVVVPMAISDWWERRKRTRRYR